MTAPQLTLERASLQSFSLGDTFALGITAANAYDAPSLHSSFKTFQIFDRATDTLALVTPHDDFTLVSFRGTVDLKNWLINLDVVKRPIDGSGTAEIKVHAGFHCALDRLLPRLLDQVPTHGTKLKLKPVIITGHSLGGALATLAAFELNRREYLVESVYTFASPRVGNAAWRTAYNSVLGSRTWRVVAAGDLVPLIPGLLDGYRHVGHEVYLNGEIWIDPSRIREITCDSFRAWRALERCDWDFILRVHSMDKDYLPLLNPKCRLHL